MEHGYRKPGQLSAEKAKLFDLLLKKKGLQVPVFGEIPRLADQSPCALSFAQQRLWLIQQLDAGSPAYNIPIVVSLKGRLKVQALERALRELVKRHESLRTTFPEVNGEVAQVISDTAVPSLPVIDLSELPVPERAAEEQRVISRQVRRSFDLTRGPLLQALLLRLGQTQHKLLLVMHHIISDGWSMRIMAQELAVLYQALSSGQPSPLPELRIQYRDYAVWQREWLQGGVLEAQLEYWKKQLSGAPTVLELPTPRPRPAIQTTAGATHSFTLSNELTARLKALGNGEGVTLFMLLMTAFQTLLYRYTGQPDMLIGTPVANRNRDEVQSLIGFFANTLVLRARLSGAASFRAALQGVRETTLDAYANQDLPFERLVEELQPARDLSHSPLFQIMFILQNMPSQELSVNGLEIAAEEVESETAKFDLLLQMATHGESLRGQWQYNADIFERAAIERMSGHFEKLLEGIVNNPDQTLSALPLLTEVERARLLYELNQAKQPLPEQRIQDLFDAQVARTPASIAAMFENEQATYAELNERANRLAHYLRARGVGPETRVGLCVERSIELVVGLVGILKAGAAYVPLDPQYPVERLAFMLDDAAAPVLLTQSRLLANLPPHRGEVVCLDTQWPEIACHSAGNVRSEATTGNLLYVIYTSGSTGRPKGIAMPQRPLLNLLLWRSRQVQPLAGTRTLQFPSLSFDVAFEDIFSTLLAGGTLVLIPEEVRQDLAGLGQVIEQKEIAQIIMTPSALQQVALADGDESNGHATLRRVTLSGEQVQVNDELIQFFTKRRECSLHNEYGPTETHVVTALDLPDDPSTWPPHPSIGRPIDNAEAYILDGQLEPAPIGVAGELYIGGVSLARGYLNRSELTAAKFIPHPFSATPGERLYRTGDVARFLAEGQIEFLGRADDQVKIRGFRVELGEVEAALLEHPAISKAVVMARDGAAGSKQLVAYLIAASPMDATALRQHLKFRLPEYMLPTSFIQLEQFPLTANGKVDRQQLPTPAQDYASDKQAQYLAPSTPAEEKLVCIWEEVLERTPVGVTDNFFEIGGHSLSATQTISRILKEFQVKLKLRDLFTHPTIKELAGKIASVTPISYAAIEPVPAQDNYPLSQVQQRLWILCQLAPQQVTYNLPVAYLLEGTIERQAFAAAFHALIARHENLRTSFSLIDDEPRQQIHEPASHRFTLEYTDLRGVANNLAEARVMARSEANTPFSLTEDSLLRARLIRLTDDRYMFLFTMHHLISDGWSMTVLVNELMLLYRAFQEGLQTPLPPLRIQYKDYAAWQSSLLRGERLETLVSYWRRRLSGDLPNLSLPLDYPRTTTQTHDGGHVPFELAPELTAQLNELAIRQQVTLFTVLFAAYNVLLYHLTGQQRLILGTSVAGRNHKDLEGLIGFFVNTLAVKTDLDAQSSFSELVNVVNQNLLEDFEHQDLPFDLLLQHLQIKRDPALHPIFQSRFVFNDFDYGEALETNARSSGLRIVETFAAASSAKFDLSTTMSLDGERLVGDMEFRADLFKRQTIEKMSRQFRALLETLVADPERRLNGLELYSPQEKAAIETERKEKKSAALSMLRNSKPSRLR